MGAVRDEPSVRSDKFDPYLHTSLEIYVWTIYISA